MEEVREQKSERKENKQSSCRVHLYELFCGCGCGWSVWVVGVVCPLSCMCIMNCQLCVCVCVCLFFFLAYFVFVPPPSPAHSKNFPIATPINLVWSLGGNVHFWCAPPPTIYPRRLSSRTQNELVLFCPKCRLDLMRTGSKGGVRREKEEEAPYLRRSQCRAIQLATGPKLCNYMPQIKIRQYVIGQRHSYSGKSMHPAKPRQGTKEKEKKRKKIEKVGCG